MTRIARVCALLAAIHLAALQAPSETVTAASRSAPAADPAGLPRAPAGPAAAVLMDVSTGRVLYARGANRPLAPASTTKILTALVVIERLSPEAIVTVGRASSAVRTGSVFGLKAGQRWVVEDLLHVLLLRSANDAAAALAEAAAGDIPRFSALMNATARALGARSSHFANPTGLDDSRHYTTAHDLALITRHALRVPRFANIARTRTWVLQRPGETPQEIVNTNQLLETYDGADGVKTGQTLAAGFTLAGSATRGGWQLLAVVLKSQDMYRDAGRLLDYGFEHFERRTVARRGEVVANRAFGDGKERLVAVVPSDVLVVVKRGAAVSMRVLWRSGLRPPIAAGVRIGTLQVVEGYTVIATAPVVSASGVVR